MATCPSCNAPVPGDATTCPFCASVTERGLEEREAERGRQAAEEEKARQAEGQRRAARVAEARKSAGAALAVSLVGVVLCAFVIPSVVALVMAVRARRLARAQGEPAPASATAAMAVAGVSLGLLAVVAVAYALDNWRLGERREALRGEVAGFLAAPVLSQPQACALAELHLLDHGWKGKSAINFKGFSCPGALAESGERRVLEDVRFYASTDSPEVRVDVCLARGARWAVDAIGPRGQGCAEVKAEAERTGD